MLLAREEDSLLPEESDLVKGNERTILFLDHTLSDTPIFTTADASTNSDLNTQINFGDNEHHNNVSETGLIRTQSGKPA